MMGTGVYTWNAYSMINAGCVLTMECCPPHNNITRGQVRGGEPGVCCSGIGTRGSIAQQKLICHHAFL